MSKSPTYDEFMDTLLAEPNRTFSPFAEYDADGDCIEFFAKPDPYYAERIDGLLTVYKSQETDEVVGSHIKGVSHLCKELMGKCPGLRVEIQDGKIHLVHILRAKFWLMPREKQEHAYIYKFLADAADQSKTEVDASPCQEAAVVA